jgi:hypothetical protein
MEELDGVRSEGRCPEVVIGPIVVALKNPGEGDP